jgi:hypothetical protein
MDKFDFNHVLDAVCGADQYSIVFVALQCYN